MSIQPVLRTPMTDLTGFLVNHQNNGTCAKLEIKAMECLEAYGLDRGKVKCADILADFNECHLMRKQQQRIWEMRLERHRQYIKGENKKHYEEAPQIDSY